MAKKRSRKPRDRAAARKPRPEKDPESKEDSSKGGSSKAMRETVESIVIAFILAFLFRSFEAEAFVIPTGSMAETLMGRHKDVQCDQCGVWFHAGDSEDSIPQNGQVNAITCPMCRHTMEMKTNYNGKLISAHKAYSGDRIIVNKFCYQFADPERWDVIVFKYPGNPKQNYIKRLVGLPGEALRIQHGDIYIRDDRNPNDGAFHIARKKPYKLKAMLQAVHDTNHVSTKLSEAGWPSSWQSWPPGLDAGWTFADAAQKKGVRRTFAIENPTADAVQWLRYRHLPPTFGDWIAVKNGRLPDDIHTRPGQLITDFYAYNAEVRGPRDQPPPEAAGLHWVGDLAMECEVTVQSDQGFLLLDLVEGGKHFLCRINVENGDATLSIGGGVPFTNEDGSAGPAVLVAKTKVRGRGDYRLRFANADDQLQLWVNERVVAFTNPDTGAQAPATFAPGAVRPRWSEDDPGDLLPLGVGSEGVAVRVNRLRVLRDIYYIATRSAGGHVPMHDYRSAHGNHPGDIMRDPTQWETTALFDARGYVDFTLQGDQFFPLGDNSPESKDGRLWGDPEYVERRYLTGKALFIYWPHAWRTPVPFTPNIGRMGFVR